MIQQTNSERIRYLHNTRQEILRTALIYELEIALSSIPANIRETNLLLQLLETRMRNPKSWANLIDLWYLLNKDFPELATLLSRYDIEFQNHQAMMIDALGEISKVAP